MGIEVLKEVLQVSVAQGAAKLLADKERGSEKISYSRLSLGCSIFDRRDYASR